jgi:hypothetical protein
MLVGVKFNPTHTKVLTIFEIGIGYNLGRNLPVFFM